jgi:hypothetical protein
VVRLGPHHTLSQAKYISDKAGVVARARLSQGQGCG